MSSSTLGWILFTLDLILRIYFCFHIIRRRLPVGVSWAWIGLILFFPVGGTIIYLYLGEYRLGRRRERRLAAAESAIQNLIASAKLDHEQILLPEPAGSFATSLRGLFDAPLLAGNDVELLKDADEAFPRLIADVDQAKVSCDVEFYIWSDGGRADLFTEALIRAAQRGVRCRVLVDQMGSSAFLKGPIAAKLRAHGIQLRIALPSGLIRSLFARPDLRLHRKVVVIDGAIAYTGSMNLADPIYFKREAKVGQWVDALARVRGPGVLALQCVFFNDWSAESGEEFLTLKKQSPFVDTALDKKTLLQCLPSGPAIKSSKIEEVVVMAIYAAKKELILTTPYFVPSESLQMALMSAARRGISVTLIVPKVLDSKVTQYASRAFLKELIESGVRVALYREGLLHTKSVTIDGEFSLFGSLNLDPRSLRINFEISLAIYDRDFTQALRTLQDSYLKRSDVLDLPTCEAQSRFRTFIEDLARLAGPLL